MREYLESFLREFEYPEGALAELLSSYDKVISRRKDDLEALISEYESNYDIDYNSAMERMKEISFASGIHEYTGDLILFLCYTRALWKYYKSREISRQIYNDTVLDLRYKLDECVCVKGVYGSFVAKWFVGFFKLERFALGRLQFEIVEFGGALERGSLHLYPDTKLINVHIPRSGAPLDRESVRKSYRLACDFYRPVIGDKIVFVCSSWLLFPRHREMLGESSNILAFMNDYDIFTSGEYSDYAEIWRLFDMDYDGDVSHLPADTSLRRAYVDLISRGERTGWGKGVFEYKK